MKINGHSLCYVTDLNCYLCTIPLSTFGNSQTVLVNYTLNDGWGKLRIDGNLVTDDQEYTFRSVEGSKDYKLNISYSNGKTISAKMKFTSLPIVILDGSFDNSYKEGHIIIQEPETTQEKQFNAKAKRRGSISNAFEKHKHNYHVKLLDEGGDKLDQKLFGLRNDNSWILESGLTDMLRIRNRILTDLWNDFSTKPYYALQEKNPRTGTRGRFVELVMNGEYRGIYCMTENLDRKQMKLKKYDEETGILHGQLWKAKTWSYAVFMGHDIDEDNYTMAPPVDYDNLSEMWEEYYLKYPNLEDVSPTDWQPLYDAVNFVCTASDDDFKLHVSDYFDLPVIIDYYILMEAIMSTDNHGKNLFYAIYDQQKDRRITLGVWDMDATLGQRWSHLYYHWEGMRPEQDYTAYIINNEHGDFNLFRRLRLTDADNFNEKVRERYHDLRQGLLGTDSILNRFRHQLAEFKICGADTREYKKWSRDSDIEGNVLDFDAEMAYIEDWLTRRLNYLDTIRFDLTSIPTGGISDLKYTPAAASHRRGVYNLHGQQISRESNEQLLHTLPPGLYIVNGQKKFVGM
ncbi:MAG: CotH kinase family protein [Prevotella sp.]|nr:CotH kinase family protein [Prevotella sp.]